MVGFKTEEVQSSPEHQCTLLFWQLLLVCTSGEALHSVRNNTSEMWMLQLKQNPAHRSLYRQHTQQPGRSPLFTCTALKLLVLHIQGRLVPKAFPAPTIWYLYLMQKPFLASNKFLLLCRCSSAEPWWECVQRWSDTFRQVQGSGCCW